MCKINFYCDVALILPRRGKPVYLRVHRTTKKPLKTPNLLLQKGRNQAQEPKSHRCHLLNKSEKNNVATRRQQLPYNTCKTYLTNYMESISYHIMPLVVNSLRMGNTHIHIYMSTKNQQNPGMRWLQAGTHLV